MLSLNNLQLIKDNVLNVTRDKYGGFDVVLCLGILYHLDTPDVMELLHCIFETCDRLTIIDTHISLKGSTHYNWNGNDYYGQYTREHKSQSQDEQHDKLWASIDNVKSFVFTLPSLCNLLRHVGFTSVYECLNPYEYHNPDWPRPPKDDGHVVWKNRVTLVAVKGQHQNLLSSPITEASPEIDRPEKPEYIRSIKMPGVQLSGTMIGWAKTFAKLLPSSLQEALRRASR